LLAAWQAEAENAMAKFDGKNGAMMNGTKDFELSKQFLILVICQDKKTAGGTAGPVSGGGVGGYGAGGMRNDLI
jgi:hypothetical protein